MMASHRFFRDHSSYSSHSSHSSPYECKDLLFKAADGSNASCTLRFCSLWGGEEAKVCGLVIQSAWAVGVGINRWVLMIAQTLLKDLWLIVPWEGCQGGFHQDIAGVELKAQQQQGMWHELTTEECCGQGLNDAASDCLQLTAILCQLAPLLPGADGANGTLPTAAALASESLGGCRGRLLRCFHQVLTARPRQLLLQCRQGLRGWQFQRCSKDASRMSRAQKSHALSFF